MTQDDFVLALAALGVGFTLIGIAGLSLFHPVFALVGMGGTFMVGYFTGWNEYDRIVTGRGEQ